MPKNQRTVLTREEVNERLRKRNAESRATTETTLQASTEEGGNTKSPKKTKNN